MRTIHVIGIGAGDPDYVTAQAVAALNDTQVFFAMDKGDTKDDLVALRRLICERFIEKDEMRMCRQRTRDFENALLAERQALQALTQALDDWLRQRGLCA